MKFILQENKLLRDFENELLWSESYWQWRDENKPENLKTNMKVIKENELENYKGDLKELCPVGSVEFVVDWLKRIHNKTPKPINVPSCYLFGPEDDRFSKVNYCGRFIVNVGENNNYKIPDYLKDREVYIKSNDVIKSSINGIHNSSEIGKTVLGNLQVSSLIKEGDIMSESRVFIYGGEILDVRNYAGSPFVIPKRNIIQQIINIYKNPPISYTLDVINVVDFDYRINSFVLEIHDFFSCGLYGFSNYEKYPFMLYRWFKEFIK